MGSDRGARGRPGRRLKAAVVLAALVGALFATPSALSAIYNVNRPDDIDHGVCEAVTGCTLRDAINAANATAGADNIVFQIGIGGSYTISTASPLPDITDSVTIDATTQTGYAGAPLIELNGGLAGPGTDGLRATGGATTIFGLAIVNFDGAGIAFSGSSSGSFVAGNYIGIGAGGSVAQGNSLGVLVASTNTTIGGTNANARNVISGNAGNGVTVSGGTGNQVLGNYIGLDASGNLARPNLRGVVVASNSNTIGALDSGNVVSGNTGVGVAISGGTSNTVAGNYIGTDAAGTAAVPNGAAGIQVAGDDLNHADGNVIGTAAGGNLISGNTGDAIVFNGSGAGVNGNVVQANTIGNDADGNALGNSGSGVVLTTGAGNANVIGSTDSPSLGNTIAHNAGSGVEVQVGVANTVAANAIYANGALGIDIGPGGVTTNDVGDGDSGANDLLNFPVLETVSRNASGNAVVTGTYDGPSPGGTNYRLDFYSSPTCDGIGFGEGATWIGTTTEPSNAAGDFSFNTGAALGYIAPGSSITATATDANGSTSEFAQCLAHTVASGTTFVVTTNADSGLGSLRNTIDAANLVTGTDTITFNLPGSTTISVESPLPAITDDVLIDGTTQFGYSGTPLVRLDGFTAGLGARGLDLEPGGFDGSTIRGLAITRFNGTGIYLAGPPSVLEGNYIGIDPVGATAAGNGDSGFGAAGIIVRSNRNRIGGTTSEARNVISGNLGAGIWFAVGSNNVVVGNRIGTDPVGSGAVANQNDGVVVQNVGPQTIGGASPGAGNIISGNGSNGIVVSGVGANGSVVQGNTIGLTADTNGALGNGDTGVNVTDSDNVKVGGSVSGAGNVIAANLSTGLLVEASSGTRIQGNLIGLNAPGAGGLGNGASNVQILGSDSVQVGGTTAAARNVISGAPTGYGLLLDSGTNSVTVQGNYIGTDATGEFAIGNAEGITLAGGAGDVTIGGAVPGARNVISGSNGPGVRVDLAGAGNRILGNSIGTDKDEATVIPNDVGIELDNTDDVQLGSTSPGAGNVIGGSANVGILVFLGSTNNTFAGNYIGTNRADTLDLGNGDGMRFANGLNNNNLVGPSNVFANNDGEGIELDEGTGNRISANSFHDNGARGIFLGLGANNNQQEPALTSAVRSGGLTSISGTLTSTPSTSYFIEYFWTPSACTAQPQGRVYLGFQSVTTDASGNASLSFAAGAPTIGQAITATATSQATRDTSEFSACRTVTTAFNLTTTVTPDASTAVAGGIDGYTITINNPSASAVTLNSVSATLPAGLYYVRNSAKLGGTFVNPFGTQPAMTGTLTWNGPFTAPAGGSFVVHFDVGVSQTLGTYMTSATASAGGGATVTTDNASITVVASLTGAAVIAPEADTYVDAADPAANFGSQPLFHTFGGQSPTRPGPQYGLLRFDLSSLPPGAAVTGARLRLVATDGFAYDGDPSHHAIFIGDDSWSETGVTWATRPDDNPGGVPDIRATAANLGSDVVFYGGLGGFGNQLHLFAGPGAATTAFAQRVTAEAAGDDKLSIELFNGCCGPNGSAYWAVYHSREEANVDLRPELIVSYVIPAQAANVQLTGPGSTTAGAGTVKLADVPPSVLLRSQFGAQATPVNETPVNETPVNELPVNELPINETPVNELGFDDLAASVPALGDITLASIPLLRTGGWIAALSGTPLAGAALQNVTLRDYYALDPSVNPETRTSPDPIEPITLADLDLSHSPLGSLPGSAVVLANVELSWMRPLDVWCRLFGTVYCSSPTALTGQTVMSSALQGAPVNETPVNELPVNETPINELPVNEVPVNETPVNEVPINELPVNETPVNELPVNETPVNETPINELPVNETPVNETPVNELPVNEIMAANSSLSNSPVNELPVNELATPNDVIDCNIVNCATATLKQAYDAGAIRPGVTLGDLRRAAGDPPNVFDEITLGELHYFGDITLRELIDSLPDDTFTLGDYFLLVLRSPTAQQGLAWEQLDIFGSGLAAFATGGPTVPYQASFDVQPGPGGVSGPYDIDVDATLPQGFVYVPGSSKMFQNPGTCGVSTPIADPGETVLPSGQRSLAWTVPTVVGNGYTVCFTARPGLTLGPQAAGLDATPVGGTTVSSAPRNITVGETFEPNDTPATGQPITTDEFLLSYVTSASDVDYYTYNPAVPPAAGSRVTVHLSHLPADYDLVVYGPSTTALRPPSSTSVPLDGAPLTDDGADLTHTSDPLPSQTLDDLNLQPGLPLVGVSASRNTDPEDIVFTYDGAGPYTIQVTGYNGATSAKPYMVRVATTPPPTTSTVASRTAGTTVGPALTLPSGLNTVFVVNRTQLAGRYTDAAAGSVITTLQNNLTAFANLGFPSTILSVDRFPNVQTAYANWNANPGDPALANAVVAAINNVVDLQVRQQPNGAGLKYLVLVGGDQVIPFARLGDFTALANESGYAATFGTNTDLFATLRLGNFLSDDPYGDVNPVPYLNRQLYVPELAVGRLVETPAQIIGAIGRFVSFSGQLDPQTALTTGYDFLTDGAQAVKGSLDGRLGNGSDSLISNTWDRSQLLAKLLPATTAGMPALVSLNGHADHYRFQPPAGATGTTRPPLFSTADLSASASPRTNRLVFSMGCHAGLSVADSIVTAGTSVSTIDWPQAYMGWDTTATPDQNAQQLGVGGYLGNTGFGYGDTYVVAFSEELNRLFAQRIVAGSAVGTALVGAKQEYFGGRGVFGVYDEKAMAEFTLYGFPMWSVTGPTGTQAAAAPTANALTTKASSPAPTAITAPTAPAAPAGPVITDPATGLDAETFDVDPITNTAHTIAGAGQFWEGPDGVQVSHLRPIQPKLYVSLAGATAHGALITALRSADQNNIDPVYARPTLDLSTNEPELPFGDVAFPSRLQAVRTFETPSGLVQRVVLVSGQFFRIAAPDVNGTGVQRLFTRIAGRALRSTSSDYIPPAFKLIESTQVGSDAAFTVDVTDRTPTGAGTVKRVLVGVRSGNAADWTFADLAQSASNPTRWTGGVPISGPQFEYFVQAVDAAGNVGVSTNKGFYFDAAPPPPPPSGTVSASVNCPAASPNCKVNGWFTVAPTLNITKPADVTIQASIDGGTFGTPPSTITGDGVHTIDIRASNGDTVELIAPVDTTPPEIVINTPANGAQYVLNSSVKADYFCRDSGSGVASGCIGTVANGANINTTSLGTKTFTVSAVTDAAGRTTPAKSVTYSVVLRRKILFSSGRTANGDIYATNPDGTGVTRLTTTTGLDEQPAWSPDGAKIAFASARNAVTGNTLDIYVMDANGANVNRLTTAAGNDTAPTWSPDGTKIAFQSLRDGNVEIYVMNTDGTNQTRLTSNSSQDIEPSWSPNGQKIVFASDRSGTLNIWVMNANGQTPTQLTAIAKPEGGPTWSPDGTKIAFASKRAEKNNTKFDIFVMKADGTNVVRLTSAQEDDSEPTWSRDGAKIAFTSMRNGNQEIYVMNSNDGTSQTRLTVNAAFDRQPDW